MINKKCLENSIEFLNVKENTLTKLKKNNISTINDIWILKRKDLKAFNLTDSEINQIIVKLQLNGLDLNKKVY